MHVQAGPLVINIFMNMQPYPIASWHKSIEENHGHTQTQKENSKLILALYTISQYYVYAIIIFTLLLLQLQCTTCTYTTRLIPLICSALDLPPSSDSQLYNAGHTQPHTDSKTEVQIHFGLNLCMQCTTNRLHDQSSIQLYRSSTIIMHIILPAIYMTHNYKDSD